MTAKLFCKTGELQGLSALIEKFKGKPMFGHITLERTVRSPLAELATKLL